MQKKKYCNSNVILCIILFQVCICNFSFGQTDKRVIDSAKFIKNKQEISNIAIDEVVVTAQYSKQSNAMSIHKINIINRKDIELSGSQNLKDILRTELNIKLTQDNILGSSLSLQGVSGENVKILIDGIPIIGRQDGNIDLSQINLNTIERIEIIEGPLSVNYGTNALAGVINLITKKDTEEKHGIGIQTYYENIGQYNITALGSIKTKKSLIMLSAGRNYFDGWSDGDQFEWIQSEKFANDGRVKEWKPKEQFFSELHYSTTLKKAVDLKFRSSYFNEKITNLGTPRTPYKESAFDDYYYTSRIDNSIQLNGKTKNKSNYSFTNAFNNYSRIKNTYYTDLTNLNKKLSQNSGDQDTISFNQFISRASFSSSKNSSPLNYEIGYDISIENAAGKRIQNKTKSISDYAIFTSVEYKPISALVIRPGLRYSYNTEYHSPIIPSINIKYDFGNKFSLRTSYAKGFRSPSLKELYFYFVDINHNIIGNSTLLSEKSNNYAISLNYLKAKKYAIYKSEISIFFNNIYNMITLAQTNTTEYTYRNIGRFQTTGIQFKNEYSVQNFKIKLGASYIGQYNKYFNTQSNINKFNFYPELNLGMNYTFTKHELTAAVFYKYSGKVPTYYINEIDQIEQQITQDYHIADITFTKNIFERRIIVGCGSKNIFNVKSIKSFNSASAHSSGSTSSPISMGRVYFIKLDIKINR